MKNTLANNSGFTLVEILISLAVFAAIAGASSYVMMGILSANKSGVNRLQTTSNAQQVAEYIKSAWDSSNSTNAQYYKAVVNYSNACVPDLKLPKNVTVKVSNLDSRGLNPSTASSLGSCGANLTEKINPVVPMRRITIQSTGKATNTIVVDILDPCVKFRIQPSSGVNTISCLGSEE